MATKKETPVTNKKANKVTITLPPVTKPDEPNFKLVGLNGKMYKIMKGVPVSVPEGVAEVLANSVEAQRKALAFMTANAR